jgi:L-alanine-DL-glutamate epimerase-like enolase superfamily enzyme
MQTEELWQFMYQATDYIGRRGIVMHAIGGIDIALWDMLGQTQQKPVAELLGRMKRDRIEAYGTILSDGSYDGCSAMPG